jgi:transcriptional regulator
VHPNPAFRPQDDEALLDWVDATGFAHLFAATPDGPMVAHAPIVRSGPRTFRFHLARGNRLVRHLAGARLLASVAGVEGYISPNWYAPSAKQVPTWNYVAAELEGPVRALDTDALVAQLDALAARHEPRVLPANPWTRAKMDDATFRQLLGAIIGFELEVEAIRGTVKLGQNKAPADIAGAIAGLEASGNVALAQAMRR